MRTQSLQLDNAHIVGRLHGRSLACDQGWVRGCLRPSPQRACMPAYHRGGIGSVVPVTHNSVKRVVAGKEEQGEPLQRLHTCTPPGLRFTRT